MTGCSVTSAPKMWVDMHRMKTRPPKSLERDAAVVVVDHAQFNPVHVVDSSGERDVVTAFSTITCRIKREKCLVNRRHWPCDTQPDSWLLCAGGVVAAGDVAAEGCL